MLAMPGALEHEIAQLISEQADLVAQRLIDDWERPDAGTDLWARAVAALYQQKQAAIIAQSARVIREHRT